MVQSMHARYALVPLLIPLCLLAACNKPGQDAVTTVSAPTQSSPASSVKVETAAVPSCLPKEAPKAAGAPDDHRESLMREVFPGWTKEHGCVLVEMDDEAQPIGELALLNPEVVMPFAADRRVLVVSAEPSNEKGVTMGGHAQPGNLATYGFTRSEGRWFVSHETASIATEGYFGNVGDVQLVELGPGHPGLTVTNGSCWQGYCARGIKWYELDADGELLHKGEPVLLDTSSTGAGPEGCEAWLQSATGLRTAPAPQGVDDSNCFAVTGTARFVSVQDQAWSDIVVDFTGADTVVDPRAQRPSARAIHETAVWRRQGDTYELVQGRNPTHPF